MTTIPPDLDALIPQEAELVRRVVQEIALYPQIRDPVLRFLLAEDFPALVDMVRKNAANIELILERLGVVEKAVARIPVIEEKVERLERTVGRLDSTVGRLDSTVGRLDNTVEGLVHTVTGIDRSVRVLQGQVGKLRGTSYEDKCREQIAAVLDGYMSRAVPVDRERINTLLVNARHAGQITRAELIDGYNADIIARAMDDLAAAEMLAVVEVSITFNSRDLETAARRAELIGRITGVPTAAYLATHHDWPETMNAEAANLGVTIISYPLEDFAFG